MINKMADMVKIHARNQKGPPLQDYELSEPALRTYRPHSQKRYFAKEGDSRLGLHTVSSYIHRKPIYTKVPMVERLEDYPYSSFLPHWDDSFPAPPFFDIMFNFIKGIVVSDVREEQYRLHVLPELRAECRERPTYRRYGASGHMTGGSILSVGLYSKNRICMKSILPSVLISPLCLEQLCIFDYLNNYRCIKT